MRSQTICLDKTGTVTMNRMSVVAIHTGMKHIRISENNFVSGNGIVNPYSNDELLRLIHISVLCNESEVTMNDGEYILNGSSTENALLHMAISTGVDIDRLRKKFPLTRMVPPLRKPQLHGFLSCISRRDRWTETFGGGKGEPQ